MGFLSSLLKMGVDIIETPVAIVKDTITLGGSLTDEPSATGKKLSDISQDWQKMKDSLDAKNTNQ